jgi:DinB superfamily
MDLDWNAELRDQLDWHWRNQFRPRLDGLTDAEYFWEPVAGCWSVRPAAEVRTPESAGGVFRMEFTHPEPDPAPITTIAWRLGHVIVGCLLAGSADHFGGEPIDRETYEYAGSAATALDQLDAAYARWSDGVRSLGTDGLTRPCGPAEGPFAESPLASLILHINRELLHHGAEIALLRDLYLRLGPA